jgi:acyl transferase domain-containing protein
MNLKGVQLGSGFFCKVPLRGALVIGAASACGLLERARAAHQAAEAGWAIPPVVPAEHDLRASERLTIDYGNAAELKEKLGKALKALTAGNAAIWKALRAQGIFRGHGPAGKVAFLYTGLGSQYANMLKTLRAKEPVVADTFSEADRVMMPLLGKPLTDCIFVDPADSNAVAKAEEELLQAAIAQPAVLATGTALTRLLAAYGIEPDMVMGHSLGEYGALVAAGALSFQDSLEAVSARGRGLTDVDTKNDRGRMAAVLAPLDQIDRILRTIDDYVVIANVNSNSQAVIGGATAGVRRAIEAFRTAGYDVAELPVSHAFHTGIVAAAGEALRRELQRLHFQSPRKPVVANLSGGFYPTGSDVAPRILEILTKQVFSPVQFVRGLNTLYDAGARVFVEVGPKKALQGFAAEVLGDRDGVVSVFTNHPKFDDFSGFNRALCALYAEGLGTARPESSQAEVSLPASAPSIPASVLWKQPTAPAMSVSSE